jgi:hypothetical protein
VYNKILFSLLLFPISLVSMDVEPLSDSTFLLWCGALACKEIKREQVINQTPRQRFLKELLKYQMIKLTNEKRYLLKMVLVCTIEDLVGAGVCLR